MQSLMSLYSFLDKCIKNEPIMSKFYINAHIFLITLYLLG